MKDEDVYPLGSLFISDTFGVLFVFQSGYFRAGWNISCAMSLSLLSSFLSIFLRETSSKTASGMNQ